MNPDERIANVKLKRVQLVSVAYMYMYMRAFNLIAQNAI